MGATRRWCDTNLQVINFCSEYSYKKYFLDNLLEQVKLELQPSKFLVCLKILKNKQNKI